MPEIELKLVINNTIMGQQLNFNQYDIIKNHTTSHQIQHLVSIYYDTADLDLHHNRFALRTRQMPDGSWIQTIKGKGQVLNGLHTREEIEFHVHSSEPIYNANQYVVYCDDNQRAMLQNLQNLLNDKPLIPIFTTEFDREIHWLAFENGDQVEFAFDSGKISLGSRFSTPQYQPIETPQPAITTQFPHYQSTHSYTYQSDTNNLYLPTSEFSTNSNDNFIENQNQPILTISTLDSIESIDSIFEIELELKAGNVERLYQIGLELNQYLPLGLGSVSKAERGYQLYRPQMLQPQKATKLILSRDHTVQDTFIRIVYSCLSHLQSNEIGFIKYGFDDIEFLHQLRVSLRRLRSIFDVFKPILPKESLKDIMTEIKFLNNVFGPARDWDVLTQETLPNLFATLHDHPDLPQLKQTLGDVQRKYVLNAQQAVTSKHYSNLLLLLNQWILQHAWRTHSVEIWDSNAFEFSKKTIQKKHNIVYKLGKGLKKLNEEQRHEFRILCKKLRYTTEFFTSYYNQECEIISAHQVDCTHRYSSHLSKLQDILGLLNDSCVAKLTLNEIQPPLINTLQREMLDCCLSQMEEHHKQLTNKLYDAWDSFVECEWYWNPKPVDTVEESNKNHIKAKKVKSEKDSKKLSKEEELKLKRRRKEIQKLYK